MLPAVGALYSGYVFLCPIFFLNDGAAPIVFEFKEKILTAEKGKRRFIVAVAEIVWAEPVVPAAVQKLKGAIKQHGILFLPDAACRDRY